MPRKTAMENTQLPCFSLWLCIGSQSRSAILYLKNWTILLPSPTKPSLSKINALIVRKAMLILSFSLTNLFV